MTHRYGILFYSLLATLAAGPLLNALGFNARLLEVFLAVNLLAAAIPSALATRGVPLGIVPNCVFMIALAVYAPT
jgi:hypothetical protein